MSGQGAYASPPCMAAEVDPTYFDPLGRDPVQARDVARWRRAERRRLARLGDKLGQPVRAQASASICGHLRAALASRGIGRGTVLAGYWPIRCEPDLRPLLSELHRAGVTIVLPVVAARAAPLVFRRWTPASGMVRGAGDIPVPPADAGTSAPDLVLVPCLGCDAGCHRLGRGGGYYDRTLAALSPGAFSIGVAYGAAKLPTIYPQPHDIALDLVVTEAGAQKPREATE